MDVRLRWTNSTPNPANQKPLAFTKIEERVSDTMPWSEIARVPAPASELLLQQVSSGDHFWQATEIDTDGVESVKKQTTSLRVGFAPPSGVVDASFVAEPA